MAIRLLLACISILLILPTLAVAFDDCSTLREVDFDETVKAEGITVGGGYSRAEKLCVRHLENQAKRSSDGKSLSDHCEDLNPDPKNCELLLASGVLETITEKDPETGKSTERKVYSVDAKDRVQGRRRYLIECSGKVEGTCSFECSCASSAVLDLEELLFQ